MSKRTKMLGVLATATTGLALACGAGCQALPAAAVAVQAASDIAAAGGAMSPRGQPAPVLLPPADAQRFAGHKKLLDVTHGNNRLLVYSYGEAATLLQEGRLRLSGFVAVVINRRAGAIVYETGAGEADAPVIVDYTQAGLGVYGFTQLADDVRQLKGEPAPFVATTVTVTPDGRVREKARLLLAPETGGPADVAQWRDTALKALSAPDADPAERVAGFLVALIHIRNLAVTHPDEALAAMAFLKASGKLDGHLAEMWSGYSEEVRLVRKLTRTRLAGS